MEREKTVFPLKSYFKQSHFHDVKNGNYSRKTNGLPLGKWPFIKWFVTSWNRKHLKKKSYLIFFLTTNHLSVQAIVFFSQHHHLTKTCNPSRELTYDKLFTTLILVHRMTDSKRCVPVHLYYIQLSRTITGKDLISWKDVHTVPEKFR